MAGVEAMKPLFETVMENAFIFTRIIIVDSYSRQTLWQFITNSGSSESKWSRCLFNKWERIVRMIPCWSHLHEVHASLRSTFVFSALNQCLYRVPYTTLTKEVLIINGFHVAQKPYRYLNYAPPGICTTSFSMVAISRVLSEVFWGSSIANHSCDPVLHIICNQQHYANPNMLLGRWTFGGFLDLYIV